MACGKVTFLRFSFFWVFSCAFCVGLLWSPPVYCVEVASLLCRSRWFTVLKSPVYCVEVVLVYRQFTVLKSSVYCVEVTVLPCRSHHFVRLVVICGRLKLYSFARQGRMAFLVRGLVVFFSREPKQKKGVQKDSGKRK